MFKYLVCFGASVRSFDSLDKACDHLNKLKRLTGKQGYIRTVEMSIWR